MNKLKSMLYKFSQGRYGTDSLNRFIIFSYIILVVANIFIKSDIITSIYTITVVLLIYRMLSRNIYKRQQENQKYLNLSGKFKKQVAYVQNKWRFRKTHIYRKCPFCSATIRLPRKKGKHICSCPSCKKDFKVKSY